MMSGNPIRRQVLQAFKKLHLTRKQVFRDDDNALNAARTRINEEFKKNKSVTNEVSIVEMITFANAVEMELRTSVIQAVETKPGTFEVRITKDTVVDNFPLFDSLPKMTRPNTKKCRDRQDPMPCQGETQDTKKETGKTQQSANCSP